MIYKSDCSQPLSFIDYGWQEGKYRFIQAIFDILRYFCPKLTAAVYAYKILELLIILESQYFPSYIRRRILMS